MLSSSGGCKEMRSTTILRRSAVRLPDKENSRVSRDLAILIAVLAFVMLITANSWGVVEPSEARYAEISREMITTHDWLHPTLLNIHHYHKPPLTYWITALAYSIFGVNNFGVRFFLTIAFCAQVFVVFKLSVRLFRSEQIAFNSSLVFATLPLVLISARALTTDMYLNLFVLLTIYMFVNFFQDGKIRFVYLASLSMGLGFLTKGPVIFIVPLLAIVGLWKMFSRPRVTVIQAIVALLMFASVGLTWFGYLIVSDSRFFDYFVLHHFVDRIAHAEVFSRKEPWYYYLPVVPLVTLPWIVTFASSIFKKPASNNERLTRRILLWWFVIPLLFFSASSSKLVLYILPLSIGFSIVTGYYLSVSQSSKPLIVSALVIILIYAGLTFVPFLLNLRTSILLTVIPVASFALSVASSYSGISRQKLTMVWSGLFALCLIGYSSLFFRLNSDMVNTLSDVSLFIKQKGLDKGNVVVYDELLPSLAFELNRDVVFLYGGNRALQREVQFEQNEDWRFYLINTSEKPGRDLSSLLSGKSVLITKKDLPPNLTSIVEKNWNKQMIGKWTVYHK